MAELNGAPEPWLTLKAGAAGNGYSVCIDATAKVGSTSTQELRFVRPDTGATSTVNLVVEVRNPNIVDLQVNLAVVDPKVVVVGNRTIVPSGVDLLVQATRVLGDLHDFTGSWDPMPGDMSMATLKVDADLPTQYAQGLVKFTSAGKEQKFQLTVTKVVDASSVDTFKSPPVEVKDPGTPLAVISSREVYVTGGVQPCFPGISEPECQSFKICIDGSASRANWQVAGNGSGLAFDWATSVGSGASSPLAATTDKIVVCKVAGLHVTLKVGASGSGKDEVTLDF